MPQFLVTIKIPRGAGHDPHNKKTGMCPANPGRLCSDITGEHHTMLWEGESLDQVHSYWEDDREIHLTRVEEV